MCYGSGCRWERPSGTCGYYGTGRFPCEIDDDEESKLKDELDDYAESLFSDYATGEISQSQARAAYKQAKWRARNVHDWER